MIKNISNVKRRLTVPEIFIIPVLLILIIISDTDYLHAEINTSIRLSGGGRYDKVRMCVANDAGKRRGPMADISAVFHSRHFEFNLPVMRPILFASAFDMLQFEPEATFTTDSRSFAFYGLGVGTVLHYGPDYIHDMDNRGEEFYAYGPRFSIMAALNIREGHSIALRAFASPLFSADYETGTVLGIQLEYTLHMITF